ncbi:hypothetical protein ACS0TY_005035 [Phlomoides rotata]
MRCALNQDANALKFQTTIFGTNVPLGSFSLQKHTTNAIQPIKATAIEIPPTVPKSRTSWKTKIGINDFGRIGRLVLRIATFRGDIDVVAVNDPFIDAKYMAYMFKYNSTHGPYKGNIGVIDESTLEINGKRILVSSQRNLTEIPWGDHGVEYVVESSGVFTSIEKASAQPPSHLFPYPGTPNPSTIVSFTLMM